MTNELIKIGDKTYKPAQVIMLPTDKANNTCLIKNKNSNNTKGLFWSNNRSKDSYFAQDYLKSADAESYHLYIVSSEEIKELP